MAPFSSKLHPRVAYKRSAMLEWHLPPLNVSSGASQKACYLGMCHHQVARKWAAVLNGSYLLLIYPQVVHKRSATLELPLHALNFNLGWLANGLLPWNGSSLSPTFLHCCVLWAPHVSSAVLQFFFPQRPQSNHDIHMRKAYWSFSVECVKYIWNTSVCKLCINADWTATNAAQ